MGSVLNDALGLTVVSIISLVVVAVVVARAVLLRRCCSVASRALLMAIVMVERWSREEGQSPKRRNGGKFMVLRLVRGAF